MGDMLSSLRYMAYSRMGTLPKLQWFEPTPTFWHTMDQWRTDIAFVDAGCGLGNLTREAKKRGFDMMAVDICKRVGQVRSVMLMDACVMPYTRNLWPILCRPSHDGWAYGCISRALEMGASALYVSLPHNAERDLDDLQSKVSLQVTNVGAEGETLYLIGALP